MSNNSEQILVEFHNKAMEKFFLVYHSFEKAISKNDRKTQERNFQDLKKHYVAVLEKELTQTALDLLSRNRLEKQSNELNLILSHHIRDYLHRFVQKVED
jgi:hypothetical protein